MKNVEKKLEKVSKREKKKDLIQEAEKIMMLIVELKEQINNIILPKGNKKFEEKIQAIFQDSRRIYISIKKKEKEEEEEKNKKNENQVSSKQIKQNISSDLKKRKGGEDSTEEDLKENTSKKETSLTIR